MQEVLVFVFVAAAVFFVGRMTYRQFFAKESKCDGCAVGKMAEKG